MKHLQAIVCGFEHSGTTVVSQMLRQHPALETGFEVGALMYSSPRHFFKSDNPWSKDQGLLWGTWKISAEDQRFIRRSWTFNQFYERLKNCSPLTAGRDVKLIDKTPAYALKLSGIIKKWKLNSIVMIKDPVTLRASSHVQSALPHMEGYLKWYRQRIEAIRKAKHRHPDAVMVVKWEDLIIRRQQIVDAMFRHIGMEPEVIGIISSLLDQQTQDNKIIGGELWSEDRIRELRDSVEASQADVIREQLEDCVYSE